MGGPYKMIMRVETFRKSFKKIALKCDGNTMYSQEQNVYFFKMKLVLQTQDFV